MRILSKPQVSSAILGGLLVLLAACGKPSSQSLQSLSLTATPSTVSVGGASILRATAHLSDGTTQDVTSGTVFTVSNPSLASIANGVLTSQSTGSLTVQGAFVEVASSSAAAAAPQTLSSSIQVTITPAGTTTTTPVITWSAPAAIPYGTALSTAQLDAQASVPGTFSYSPAAGTVLQAGTQTLTTVFTPTDTQHNSAATASVQLTVLPTTPPAPAVPSITWSNPAPITYGTALSSVQLNATASVPGTFVYTPPAGTVLQAGTQTLTAVFTPTDTTDYATANATVQIVVSAPPGGPIHPVVPTITWAAPASIGQGTALSSLQLNATANVPGTFVYAPAAGTVLPAGTQTLTTTFTPTDTTDYATAIASVQIVVLATGPVPVNPVAPVITWSTPAAIVYGAALSSTQLDATANVPGAFAYTPAPGAVLQAGSQTLTTTFTPADTTHFSVATATVSLAVTQATPVISWAAPAAIAQGTALSAAQLNATANVAGAFTYLPRAGTVPPVGTIQLAATFTPADAVDYTTASALRSLAVTGTANPVPTGCGGPTINLDNGMSQSTLQSEITNAPNCALIVFAAGTYNLTASIHVPCSANLTLTGPAVTPATAILSASASMTRIFYITGCNGVTFEYLGFANTTGIYADVPATGSSGINISYSQFFGLSGSATDYLAETGIYFTGYSTGGTLSNVNVSWNNFGSPTDCAGAMTELKDQGGYCSGIVFTASLNNIMVSNNTFLHLEEGFHVNCTQPGCVPPTSNTWNNFTAQNNDFSQIHRIAMEMQPQPSSNILIQYNSEHDFLNGYDSTFGISSACCNTGASSPGTIDSNNVVIANNPVALAYPTYDSYAMEFWGNGAIAQGNLVQGYWAYGIVWGYAPNAVITNNNLCGPNMANGNRYIANEERQATPTIAPNTTSPTCSAVISTPPTISPASGTVSGLTTVTLADSGVNHSVYYTLDGSTPTTSSTLYTGPFAVAPGTTVNAIGMWGQGANAKSYPDGYGYVPSGVITATYLDGSLARPAKPAAHGDTTQSATTPAALQSITVTPSQAALAIGSTLQLKAVANFSDGSARDITGQFNWTSSDIRTIAANGTGLVSGLATGHATISGVWQGHTATLNAFSSIGALPWSGPITITHGGAYSGNWESNDPHTAAVTIATKEAVVIENAHMRSVSALIETKVPGANLTLRNNVAIASGGSFLTIASPAQLDVENNYVENVSSGIVVHGYSGRRDGSSNLIIRANRGRNLTGPVESFIELDQLQAVPGIDIGWNEIIDHPSGTSVGDSIRIYQSGGTANQPLDIHDGYIQGANNGGGIFIDGGADPLLTSAFNDVRDNQVVATGSHGIAFAGGHDNRAFHNSVFSSGLLADGTKLLAPTVGMASEGSYNNTMHDNLIGWMCWACQAGAYRNDASFPSAPRDYATNLQWEPQNVTFAAEQAQYQQWVNKATAAGERVGPAF